MRSDFVTEVDAGFSVCYGEDPIHMILQVLDGLIFNISQPMTEKRVPDQTSPYRPRLSRIGALDINEGFDSVANKKIIRALTLLPVNELRNDEPKPLPRKRDINARSTHGCAFRVVEVLRDKVLCPSFAHVDFASVFDPYVADVRILVGGLGESESDTADVDSGYLARTQFEGLSDYCLAVWDVCSLVFVVDENHWQNFGGHAGELCSSR